jgi:zinc/manganese transport system substrate-binding protein
VAAAVAVAFAGVGGARPVGAAPAQLRVVAAEDFWGSIVEQLAGPEATVSSIITNPATDPHDYEPKPSDARAIASARYVIANGIGYDSWVQKLLDANPDSHRKVLDVGRLLGVEEGGNPHQWYSRASVQRFVDRVTRDLTSLDHTHAAYYARRKAKFETKALAGYSSLISEIEQRYRGTPVGASESIFTPMARSLGLKLLTPGSFLQAISEGAEPTAHDKATVDDQIRTKAIAVFVYNSQNATPDVKAIVRAAEAKGIPVTTITETLVPEGATFQAWQVRQLRALQRALAAGHAS